MAEAWMLELLGSLRDMARTGNMPRLAEHLDDAMLIAASESHDMQAMAGHDLKNPEARRTSPQHGLH